MGNPDVEPEDDGPVRDRLQAGRSTPDFGFDLTIFYKDIRDLLGVEFVDTYTGAEYARLTNVDFGNIFGITLALDHRRIGPPGPVAATTPGSRPWATPAIPARRPPAPPPARTRSRAWCLSTGTSGTR